MEDPLGQLLVGQLLGAKAEDIGGGDGPGGDAQDIPHHAAHAGIGAAEGLQCGGVVVGFDLEGQVVGIVEGDDARIVHKGGVEPGRCNGFRGRANVSAQETVDGLLGLDLPRPVQPGEVDAGAEGLVDAVLGPGLGQGFQLHIGGIPALGHVEGLDCAHLGRIQGEEPVPAEGEQLRVGQGADGHRFHLIAGLCSHAKLGYNRAQAIMFHRFVTEELAGQAVQVGLAQVSHQLIAHGRGYLTGRQAQFGHPADQLPGFHIGDARPGGHLDDGVAAVCRRRCAVEDLPVGLFCDRVYQQKGTEPLD